MRALLLRAWTILALLVGIRIYATYFSPHENVAQMWASSGLTSLFAGHFISDHECRSSARYLKACQMALPDGDFDTAHLKDKSPQGVASVLSQFLSAFDPHARVVPTSVLERLESRPDVRAQEVVHGVWAIRVGHFAQGTCELVRASIDRHPEARAWVLDLRGNPGGVLGEGQCVAGAWIGGMVRVGGEKTVEIELPAKLELAKVQPSSGVKWVESWSGVHTSKPLVVLIDAETASAAEVVASALQDWGRALIVGERSFGKGSMQVVEPLAANPRVSVVHTVGMTFRPLGGSVQLRGVTPDIEWTTHHGAKREGEIFPGGLVPPPTALIHEWPRLYVQATRECVRRSSDLVRRSRDPVMATALEALECYDQRPESDFAEYTKK